MAIRRRSRFRALKLLYRKTLRLALQLNPTHKIIVLNHDDKAFFQDYSYSPSIRLIRETGVQSSDINQGLLVCKHRSTTSYPHSQYLNVGYIGRLLYEKGIDHLISLIQLCCAYQLPTKFFLCGTLDKYNSSNISETDHQFLREHTSIKAESYSQFFQKIDILVFPSKREGHPKYILQAMAYGVPSIVYSSPGLDVDVIHDHNGLVTPTIGPTSLFSSLLYLINHPGKLQEFRDNSIKYASLFNQRQIDHNLLSALLP